MSELPRLLFCCFDVVPGPSAISRRLTEYIKGLSERFQVVVLSAKTPDHPHIERYHGARLLRVPVGSGDLPARSQTFDRAVRRQLESEDYGLVHFFDPFAGYALCERRSELGYRLVYDACTFPSVELPLENPALATNRRFVARVRRQELFCLMNADGVVVGSPLTADYVAGLGVDRGQVRVLRAPIDLEPFTPEVMGKPDATPMKVLHLGRATQGQGLELLLEALQLALQTVDVRLAVVSPPNPEAQGRLEARVAELKLTGKVEFQPPVAHDDIHKVLATADVGALTLDDVERNRMVGTPLARLGEYLAAGRPVIAADVPGARALLPTEGAVLYRPGDARSLADALVQLAADSSRRVKLGAAARAAATEWDSARVRLELVKLYADVTGASVESSAADAPADPFEPTQLGKSPSAESGEITQLGARARGAEDSNVGTNKVKTDPAISAGSDSSTDAAARAQRAPIMGVPLRDEPSEERLRQAVTDPGAPPPSEPPVVMGAPLREGDEGPASAASVAAALADAVPAPLPGFDNPPPVSGAPPASFDDEVRTDLRAPLPVEEPPAPTPSVPTVPEASEPPPGAAAAVPPPVLPEGDEPFVPQEAFRAGVAAAPRDASGSAAAPGVASKLASASAAVPGLADVAPKNASASAVVPGLHAVAPREASAPAAVPALAGVAPKDASAPAGDPGLAAVAPRDATGPAAAPGVAAGGPTAGGASTTARATAPPAGTSALTTAPSATAPGPTRAATTPVSTGPLPAPAALSQSPALGPLPGGLSSAKPGTGGPVPPPQSAPSTARATSGAASSLAPTAPKPPTPAPAAATPTARPATPAPPHEPADGADEEIAEIDSDEVMDVDEPSPADTAEELLDADEAVQTVDSDPSPPPSALDPWLAQLVHGHCPPESHLFDRHTPPTTMPGRDT